MEAQFNPDEPVISQVRVTNGNDFKIEDRFDGVPYTFDPKVPKVIPLDAAMHIFGWYPGSRPEDVFRHTARRLGWNIPQHEAHGAHKRFFERLEIEPVVFKMVEVVPEQKEVHPAAKPRLNKMIEAAQEAQARHVR